MIAIIIKRLEENIAPGLDGCVEIVGATMVSWGSQGLSVNSHDDGVRMASKSARKATRLLIR